MPNLWQRLFKLEQEVTQSSPARPAIHELIERSPAELADYEQWKSSFILRRLLDWLADQYAIYLHDPQAIDGHTDFLNTPSSQGFILHFHDTNYTRREATFLFDYLKERVLTLNYRTQISDTMTYTRPRWVETMEKHYLKPRLAFVEGEKQDQQYGNIMIELEVRDDQVQNLRLRATHYRDYNFSEPLPFYDLMQVLLHRDV